MKAYVCLFISLATKAVHLELVPDLTANGFLAAFTRFTARRGCSTEIHSDNGTNYVGAKYKLGQLHDLLQKGPEHKQICRYFLTEKIKWPFTP